eukprot:397179_1
MAQLWRRVLLSPNSRVNAFICMMKHPKGISIGFTCIKTLFADLVVQTCVDGHSVNTMDWTRAAVFGSFGFVYLGVFQYWLYNIVYFKWFPSVTLISTAKKVAFDQFIKTPILYWPTFYSLQAALNERQWNAKTLQSVISTYQNNIVTDMKAVWTVWIPAQMITFGVMPLHLRLVWNASISFFWCCILSFMHGEDKHLKRPHIADIGK